MITNHYFAIGKQHKVCQDYALSDTKCIIVSDGCSSAKDTDIGSRLWSIAAKRVVGLVRTPDEWTLGQQTVPPCITQLVTGFAEDLMVDKNILHATLLVGYELDNIFRVLVMGDGLVVAKAKNGRIMCIEHSFTGNAPFYACYDTDEAKVVYKAQFGDTVEVTKTLYDMDWSVAADVITEVRKINFDCPFLEYNFKKDDWDMVMIASDGLESFCRKNASPNSIVYDSINIAEILKEITTCKGSGEFLTRQMKLANAAFEAKGYIHMDDLAIAVAKLES